MNEIEPRRSNPAVFPKIRNICYVVVSISFMEIATTTQQKQLVMSNWKMTLSENSSFQDPDLLFPTPSTNLFRVTAESAGALRDGANVVRTETGNYFCMRIYYKFLISDGRGDCDLGLCTVWVLVKREPLSKATSETKGVSPAEKIGFCNRSTDL